MKNSPQPASPCGPASEEELRQALENAGRRFTRQRAAVFSYLRTVDHHPTAEQVFAAVRRTLPHISLATVYKSLETLVTARLAAKMHLGNGPARYDCRTDNHCHARCLATGRVRDIPVPHDPALLTKLAPNLVETLRRAGFELSDYRLELLGRFTD